jgi:hypothetical protein
VTLKKINQRLTSKAIQEMKIKPEKTGMTEKERFRSNEKSNRSKLVHVSEVIKST